jgi:HEPN domain-containing protein
MFDLRQFVIEGHERIIAHYQRLLETAKSDFERNRFRRCIEEEQQAVSRLVQHEPRSRRAA